MFHLHFCLQAREIAEYRRDGEHPPLMFVFQQAILRFDIAVDRVSTPNEQKPRALGPGLRNPSLAESIRLAVYRLEDTIVQTDQDSGRSRFGAESTD
jgi:F0F1-type ATP synthase beta subunit